MIFSEQCNMLIFKEKLDTDERNILYYQPSTCLTFLYYTHWIVCTAKYNYPGRLTCRLPHTACMLFQERLWRSLPEQAGCHHNLPVTLNIAKPLHYFWNINLHSHYRPDNCNCKPGDQHKNCARWKTPQEELCSGKLLGVIGNCVGSSADQ